MPDDLPPLTAAGQRAAARMAARAEAIARAEAEGRDPQAAARDAVHAVVRAERRGGRGERTAVPTGAPREPRAPRRLKGRGDRGPTPDPGLGNEFELEGSWAEPRERARPTEPAAPQTAAAAPSRAKNTAIFSILTAFSRVAGLFREVLAKAFYGTSGPASAFVLAFQIPNLLRSLFADAALSAAFVPVFTDLLQQGRRKDAMKLAAELAWVVLLGLTALVAVSILLSPVIVPLFTDSDKLGASNVTLAVHLTQIMFPVVALLGINGLLVGILNAEDHFTIPALSPVVWNVLIMVFMVVTHVTLDGADELYGYAVGVLVGTIAQLVMAVPMVRRSGFRMGPVRFPHRDPQVRQVLTLMVPVALGLGLVNFNLLINTSLGFRISKAVPTAIDAAFRLYMLPQGIFSVAIATILFPALSRAAARSDFSDLRGLIGGGMRQILVLLVPAAAVTIALAAPIIRLIYEHGEFDAASTALSTEALWVFSLTLPLNGLNLLFTRTFFALKDPWATTRLAVLSLAVNVVVSFALYKPLGIGGIVGGTVAANIVVVGTQLRLLRQRLGGSLGLAETAQTAARVLVATAALTVIALVVDAAVRAVLGTSTITLLLSLGLALATGGVAYLSVLRMLGVQEAISLERALRSRFAR